MARWIILLRGVNVSGKNKVPMAEWKAGLAALGYTNIVTLQNSGNAVLDTNSDRAALIHEVTGLMRERFGAGDPGICNRAGKPAGTASPVPGVVGPRKIKRFMTILSSCCRPALPMNYVRGWANRTPTLEKVSPCGDAVFWSFDRQKYQKTNWWPRTAQEPAREWITIRTAGTVRKLAAL